MKDMMGKELAVGDFVNLPCKVISIAPGSTVGLIIETRDVVPTAVGGKTSIAVAPSMVTLLGEGEEPLTPEEKRQIQQQNYDIEQANKGTDKARGDNVSSSQVSKNLLANSTAPHVTNEENSEEARARRGLITGGGAAAAASNEVARVREMMAKFAEDPSKVELSPEFERGTPLPDRNDRQQGRQEDRQSDRKEDRQGDRQEDRKDDRQDRQDERGNRPNQDLPSTPNRPGNELPSTPAKPDNTLPGSPNRPEQGLPGQPNKPDNTLPGNNPNKPNQDLPGKPPYTPTDPSRPDLDRPDVVNPLGPGNQYPGKYGADKEVSKEEPNRPLITEQGRNQAETDKSKNPTPTPSQDSVNKKK